MSERTPFRSTQHVHDDETLRNISIGFKNEDFINDKVFPSLPLVTKQSNRYNVFGMEDFRVWDDTLAPNGRANEINYGHSTDTYFCDGHGLSRPISQQEYANADDPFAIEAGTTRVLTNNILLNKEVSCANKVMNPATYASGLSTTMGTTTVDNIFGKKWTDATADIPEQIDKAKEIVHQSSGLSPNTLIMSKSVYNVLKRHKAIIELVKYSQVGILDEQLLATALGVDRILVGKALRSVSAFGTVPAGKFDQLQYVWGNGVVLAHITNMPDPTSPSLGYTFDWDFSGEGVATRVRKWVDDASEATYVEVKKYYDQKIVCNLAGFLMADAI